MMTNAVIFTPELKATISNLLVEFFTAVGAVAIPALIALFRAWFKSKTALDVTIRGVEKGSYNLDSSDTMMLKRAVKEEAIDAGVEKHLNAAVKKVQNQLAEEKSTNNPSS